MSEIPVHFHEEPDGLDQPDRGQEGPLISGQGIQAEEPGDGLGKGESEPRQWWRRWADSGNFRRAAGTAVGTVASRAKRGQLSAAAGATTSDPEAGKTGGVSDARHTRDL